MYIDFIAMTLCDLMPPKKISVRRRQSLPVNISQQPIMPELIMNSIKTGLNKEPDSNDLLMFYLERAKVNLPKSAVGGYGKDPSIQSSSLLLYTNALIFRYLPSHVFSIYTDCIQILGRQPLP